MPASSTGHPRRAHSTPPSTLLAQERCPPPGSGAPPGPMQGAHQSRPPGSTVRAPGKASDMACRSTQVPARQSAAHCRRVLTIPGAQQQGRRAAVQLPAMWSYGARPCVRAGPLTCRSSASSAPTHVSSRSALSLDATVTMSTPPRHAIASASCDDSGCGVGGTARLALGTPALPGAAVQLLSVRGRRRVPGVSGRHLRPLLHAVQGARVACTEGPCPSPAPGVRQLVLCCPPHRIVSHGRSVGCMAPAQRRCCNHELGLAARAARRIPEFLQLRRQLRLARRTACMIDRKARQGTSCSRAYVRWDRRGTEPRQPGDRGPRPTRCRSGEPTLVPRARAHPSRGLPQSSCRRCHAAH